jgi:hypothetical protein
MAFMLPIRTDDPEFLDRLLQQDPEFAELLEQRRQEQDAGKTSSLEDVRRRLGLGSG